MKLKATWKSESCAVVAPAVMAVLRGTEPGQTCAKSTIKMNPDKFFFTNLARRKDQSESWCAINCVATFSNLVCESLRDNQIDIAISTQALITVMKYVSQSVLCTMRLTRRSGEPVLRFEFNFVDSGSCLVVHDIPVQVLRQDEFTWFEPLIPDADTRLILGFPVKKVLAYLERLRAMDAGQVQVLFENQPLAVNMRLTCSCNSTKTTFSILNQPVFKTSQLDRDIDGLESSEVNLTLKGFTYVLERVSALTDTCKCLLLACENKYLSLWIQLPNQYGSVAAITPAIIID